MLVITVGFLILYLFTGTRSLLYVSLATGLAGIFSPFLSRQIDFLWNRLAILLGYIVPNILLSLVFFLLLFPLALLARVFRKKDPLQLKRTGQSTYVLRDKVFDKASLENPW